MVVEEDDGRGIAVPTPWLGAQSTMSKSTYQKYLWEVGENQTALRNHM